MYRSVILTALASVATSSLAAAVSGRELLPRDKDCGNLTNVPLSPDPDHSTYSFQLDPSVQDLITNASQTIGVTFNMVQVHQFCNSFDGSGLTDNFGAVSVAGFGPSSTYTVKTDRCEAGGSRSPLAYRVTLCLGNGSQCSGSIPSLVCGTVGSHDSFTRLFCAVPEASGGNPKAVALSDPTPWSCSICKTRQAFCHIF
ncbi:hypothetical protein LY78DRAFT_592684 [Colletotrichum sublineola]|nr:hypothetical protein LY78DRAFT_592684 [Colletotrichum sublineola]